MLTNQFFTRVQLAKILNFKSNGMLQNLEKKGFVLPQIKPSKYTFNQVLFMIICKELTDFTDLSWKDFIDANFNNVLKENLIDHKLLFLHQYKNTNQPRIYLTKDDATARDLNDYLDGDLLNRVSRLEGRENTTYENIPSFHIYSGKAYNLLTFSIDRINRKLHNKCTELKIDLREKILA